MFENATRMICNDESGRFGRGGTARTGLLSISSAIPINPVLIPLPQGPRH